MNINIVLYVNVKEDTENVNDSEILKLFIERLRGHKGWHSHANQVIPFHAKQDICKTNSRN